MSNRPDHLTNDAITQFLRTRSADPEFGLLDDIVRTVGATPQDRPWLGLRPILLLRRTLLIVAIAMLVATMGAIGVGSLLLRRDLPVPPLPTTPDAWSRVLIEIPEGTGSMVSLAASPHGLLAVVQGGDRRERGGDGATRLVVSTDGRNWTLVPEGQHPGLSDTDTFGWPSVVGTDRGFLLLHLQEVWMSENGSDWRRLASPATDPDLVTGQMHAVTAGGPGLVAVGSDNEAWYSTDGSDWSVADVPAPPDAFFEQEGYPSPTVEMEGVTVADDKLVAWGTASATNAADWTMVAPVLWASSDGISWSHVAGPEGTRAVVAGDGGFVATGETGSEAAVWLSTDGEIWERVARDAFASLWSEDANGTLVNHEGTPVQMVVSSAAAASAGYVAVGGDGLCLLGSCPSAEAVIWTSPDGHSWSRLPSDDRFKVTAPGDPANTPGAWASDVVAWGPHFVVGGEYDGQPAIWISNSMEEVSGADASNAPARAMPTLTPDEPVRLAGRWEATDFPPDSSNLTMEVVELPDGTYDVTIHDDYASVCNGAPSRMTGVAESMEPVALVIERPEYTCDDGSQPEALSGPPLEEQLSNLSFTYDALPDALYDSFGLEWRRMAGQ